MTKAEKEIREQIGAAFDQMKALTDKAKSESRSLTKAEKEKHEKIYEEVANLKQQLDTEMTLNPDYNGAVAVNDMMKPNNRPRENGVRFLNKGESFYNPREAKDEADKMPAGSFLRAAMIEPKTPTERAAIQNSVTSSGYTLPTGVSAQIIDQLREMNPVTQAGGRSLELPREAETNFVTITDYPDAVWHAELDVESTDSPTFSKVTMSANTLLSLFEVSRELEQDSANLDEALRLAFVGSLNDALVTATFTGQGANAPDGLDTLITQTQEYSNGSDPTWSTMVAAQKKLYNNHVPKEDTATIHDPDNWEALVTQTGNDNHFIDPPRGIADIPEFTAAGVPAGTSYSGQWSNVVYGYRMNISIERFPSHSAKKFGALWVAGIRVDLAVFRSSAIIRIEEGAGT